MRKLNFKNILKREEGFTLIELLIVIAVIGTLAVVLLIAVNPGEQLARTRDAGRQQGVGQLGRAMEAYAVSHNSTYIVPAATWITSLQTAGEISTVPAAITYGAGASACATNAQNGFCFNAGATGAAPMIVYAKLEAKASITKCTAPAIPWTVYSSQDGRGGTVCSAAEPAAGAQTFVP